jgi:hypothetical protein
MQISARILIPFLISALMSMGYESSQDMRIHQLWLDIKLEGVISFDVFNTAILGYNRIEKPGKRNILTIIDFSKPSSEKRFFVIDLENKVILYRCLVAHGRNSGDNYAKNFSNLPGSLMSPLGFFLTAETYTGDNGYSLKLEGLEKGLNDNARTREIVIHGAKYVSEEFIKVYGRLGRSWGCPAIPDDISKEIIDKIAGGSCLFIYGDDFYYKEKTVFLKQTLSEH